MWENEMRVAQVEKTKGPLDAPQFAGTHQELFRRLGLGESNCGVFGGEWIAGGPWIESISPIDGQLLGRVQSGSVEDYQRVVQRARAAFLDWQTVPAPRRGEIVRQLGNALREVKAELGRLVTLETG